MQAPVLGILMPAALGVGPCVAHGYLAEAGEGEPAVSGPPARDTAPCPQVSSGPPGGGDTRSLSLQLLTSHEAPSFLQKQGN